MTTDPLMSAILAMDSYNRGYNEGITGLGGLNTLIGNYKIILQSDTLTGSSGVDAGFYAVAYQDTTTGQVTISYRGTDQFLTANGIGGDIINGYGSGSGYTDTPQTQLAFDFYNTVKAAAPGSTISITGHSLGGGLAGLVGDVEGATTNVFEANDNRKMILEKAA